MKTKLIDLVNKYNPKNISAMVTRRPELLEYVLMVKDNINTKTISETIYCIIHDINPKICKCGNPVAFNTLVLGYREYCSINCIYKGQDHSNKLVVIWDDKSKVENMVIARKKTMMEKYGVEHSFQDPGILQKIKDTNNSRYGADSPFESPLIIEKIKKICVSKYNVEYPFQSSEIQNKTKNTFTKNHPELSDVMQLARESFVEQHGCNPFALDEVKEKIFNTRIEKRGYKHAQQKHLPAKIIDILENVDNFVSESKGLTMSEFAEKMGVFPSTIARRAKSYNCIDNFAKIMRSKWEYKINEFLINLGFVENVDYTRGDRTVLNGKELDFYFPKLKKAIEVGALYMHSELLRNRGENYHYDKWKIANDQGIELIQYFDHEMMTSWNVIESKILYVLGLIHNTIGARKITLIKQIPYIDEQDFLQKNHLQKSTNTRTACFGAYYNNELVAVMSILIKNTEMNIIRYATTLDACYPGLFSKMLKQIISQHNITSVITFSDNRHGSGNLYKQSGFKLIHDVAPSYYYTYDYKKLEHKSKYRKDKIEKKFNVTFSNDQTEWDMMQELGYDRVWDAGKKKWLLELL